MYTGLELQITQSTSASIAGSTDINDRNMQYNIVITGLEEANTYNFTVVASNCIGSTSSSVERFTTQPACESSHPKLLIPYLYLNATVLILLLVYLRIKSLLL